MMVGSSPFFAVKKPASVSRRRPALRVPGSGPWQWKQASREDGADVLVKADGLGLKSGAQSKNGQEGEGAALHGWDVV
jgi:hypothetical protein